MRYLLELPLTARLTDGREFGNVNSLAEIEFTLENEHHVTHQPGYSVNRC
nr:hypothetical protein [uncultured Flavobacterium sp.]